MPRKKPSKPAASTDDDLRRLALAELNDTIASLDELAWERMELADDQLAWTEAGERTLRCLRELTRRNAEQPGSVSLWDIEECRRRHNKALRKLELADQAMRNLTREMSRVRERRDALRVELGVQGWSSKLAVSSHALLRFLERARGIDVDDCRAYLANPALKRAVAQHGDGIHLVDPQTGLRALVRDGIVRSVFEPQGAELAADPERFDEADPGHAPFAAMAASLSVNDHAVVRYLEVALRVDLAPIRALLSSDTLAGRVDLLGDGLYPLGPEIGLHARVEARRIVTVHKFGPHKLKPSPSRQRMPRGRPSRRSPALRHDPPVGEGMSALEDWPDSDSNDSPGFGRRLAEHHAAEDGL